MARFLYATRFDGYDKSQEIAVSQRDGDFSFFKIIAKTTESQRYFLLQALGNGHGDCDGRADHGVVAHAEEAHHLDMCRNGGGACELGVGVHAAHGVGHAVGSGTGSHIVGMEGTTRAAAGGDGEVLLALLDAFLLIGTGNGMLEAGGVGGVACDGNVDALGVHDGDAFADVIRAVAANIGALTLGVADLSDNRELTGEVIELGLNIGEAVDAGDDLRGVLAQTVENDAQRLLAGLVGVLHDTDGALCGGEGFVTGEEGEALGLLAQQHRAEIAVTETDLAVFGNAAVDAEGLQTLADLPGGFCGGLHAGLEGDGSADRVSPAGVFEADGLNALDDLIGVEALGLADLVAFLYKFWQLLLYRIFYKPVMRCCPNDFAVSKMAESNDDKFDKALLKSTINMLNDVWCLIHP